jgi:hypothetical protein
VGVDVVVLAIAQGSTVTTSGLAWVLPLDRRNAGDRRRSHNDGMGPPPVLADWRPSRSDRPQQPIASSAAMYEVLSGDMRLDADRAETTADREMIPVGHQTGTLAEERNAD